MEFENLTWRRSKVRLPYLWLMAAILVFIWIGVQRSPTIKETEAYYWKVEAARRMFQGMETIKAAKMKNHIPINREDDPNLTGMIGPVFTEITTTLGNLTSKRTATNPNFAAVIVEMLIRAGLKRGDLIAVAFSGSFPSLNLAALAAIETMGLEPIIISSVGASMWGATDPRMTWLDMETILLQKGVIHYKSVSATFGGDGGVGKGMSPDGHQMTQEAILRNGVEFLSADSLVELIEREMELYHRYAGLPIKAFINVGGTAASLGSGPLADRIPTGLQLNLQSLGHPRRGLIFRMAETGIPVIHLLNIRSLALQYRLPIDPIPLPQIGEGPVYFTK
ncbi:MAG: poly-gamma-glutamate system protein, partial [Candidatus Binatia bacterium]